MYLYQYLLYMQIIARFTTGGGRQCSTDSALVHKAHWQFNDLLFFSAESLILE